MDKKSEGDRVEREVKKGEGNGQPRKVRDLKKEIESIKEKIIKETRNIVIHQNLINASKIIIKQDNQPSHLKETFSFLEKSRGSNTRSHRNILQKVINLDALKPNEEKTVQN